MIYVSKKSASDRRQKTEEITPMRMASTSEAETSYTRFNRNDHASTVQNNNFSNRILLIN